MPQVQAVMIDEAHQRQSISDPDTGEYLGDEVLIRRQYDIGDDRLVAIVHLDAEAWPLTEVMRPVIETLFHDEVYRECEARGIVIVGMRRL